MNHLLAVLMIVSTLSGARGMQPDSALNVNRVNDFEVTGEGFASEWNRADWVELSSRSGSRRYQTQFKILYSGKGIYCLFRCEDKEINSTIRENNAPLHKEDVVEAFFWPDDTRPVYFEYELSPHNFELPLLVPNYNGNFFGWLPWNPKGDRQIRHATKIISDKNGTTAWIAEFFIPYAVLMPLPNVPPQKGTRWRANFYRIDHDESISHWSWKPFRKTFHDYTLFGEIRFGG